MTLQDADRAAKLHSPEPLGSAVLPCRQIRTRIRVLVVGEDARGLDGIKVVLDSPDRGELHTETGPDGACLFDGLEPGNYRLGLPFLDQDAWRVLSLASLDAEDARSDVLAQWSPKKPASPGPLFTHQIVEGECISMLGYRHGLLPDTIWQHSANMALRDSRDSLYILAPGDQVTVPARRPHAIGTTAGSFITLQRVGVPERLRIRFLSYDDAPRSGLPYLLSVESESGAIIPVQSAVTDEGGFVDAGIPPDSVIAEIVLGYGDERETHRFELGKAAPISSVAGWQSRLENLGYLEGAASGVLDPATRGAIEEFQRARGLAVTGEMDDRTFSSLRSLALS